MLFSLPFARLVFSLQAVRSGRLPPYKGSVLRGALGHSFRRLSCHTRGGSCLGCMFGSRCPYAYVFETTAAALPGNFNHHYIPRSFIIEPPVDGRTDYEAGEKLEFTLLLLGRGLDYLPHFITSFERAAAVGLGAGRVPFALTAVDGLRQGRHLPLWRGGDRLLAEPEPEDLADLAAGGPPGAGAQDTVTLEFLTPTRLVNDGQATAALDFPLFMRSVFRRLDLLGRAHGKGPLELPFGELLARAGGVALTDARLAWSDWARYSHRQKKQVLMGGLTGSFTAGGDLEPFDPFIRMAEVVHVGKGTVYGMGKMGVVRA